MPTANANEPIDKASGPAPPGIVAAQQKINTPEAMAADQLYGSAPPADDTWQEAAGGFVKGTSLWKDAWKRLRKNKLAVMGLVVVLLILLATLVGPMILKATTGYTYDLIPGDRALVKAMPPSWKHPMGTDPQGRDIQAR
jgi:hypothetical protein